jgi:hypothetical protein
LIKWDQQDKNKSFWLKRNSFRKIEKVPGASIQHARENKINTKISNQFPIPIKTEKKSYFYPQG